MWSEKVSNDLAMVILLKGRFGAQRCCIFTYATQYFCPVRSGVRTHADIRPLELKSNALTTRPSWQSLRGKNNIGTISTFEKQLVPVTRHLIVQQTTDGLLYVKARSYHSVY